MKFQAKHVN